MLLEQFDQIAKQQPAAPAFVHDRQILSYGQARRLVDALALALLQRGIQPGQTVGLSMVQAPLHCIALLALARLGAISLPLSPLVGLDHQIALCRRYGVQTIVSSWDRVAIDGVHTLKLESLSLGDAPLDTGPLTFVPTPDTPLRYALTSGTSGVPKGILHTHQSFMQRMTQTLLDLDGQSRLLPPELHVTLGTFLTMGALCNGATVVFPVDYQVQHIASAIQGHGVTHWVMVPSQAATFASALPPDGRALTSIRHLRLVGATPSPRLLAMLKSRCTDQLFVPYAIAEVGVIAIASPAALAAHPGTAGVVCPWAKVEIVDADGQPLPEGAQGEIRVQVAGMPGSYAGDTAQTALRFRQGWFYTGDLGRISPEGLLYVDGRVDDQLNLSGIKLDPSQIEQVIEAHPHVHRAAVLALPQDEDEPALIAVLTAAPGLDLAALQRYCAEQLEALAPQRYVLVEDLPLTATGKIIRHALRALLAND